MLYATSLGRIDTTRTRIDLTIPAFASCIAKQCRWAGHCPEFYSVAEHSINVYRLVQAERPDDYATQTLALFHELDEVVGDIVDPIKKLAGPDLHAELARLRALAAKALNIEDILGSASGKTIPHVDREVMRFEAHAFFSHAIEWCDPPTSRTVAILSQPECLSWEIARMRFVHISEFLLWKMRS